MFKCGAQKWFDIMIDNSVETATAQTLAPNDITNMKWQRTNPWCFDFFCTEGVETHSPSFKTVYGKTRHMDT